MNSLFRSPILPWLTAVLGTIIIGCTIHVLEHPIPTDDSLRHITMARLMREEGTIVLPRGWGEFLYGGIFAHNVSDPWFLWDVLQLPLTPFSNATAVEITTVVMLALLLSVFLFALSTVRSPPLVSAILTILLLFGNSMFTFRLLLARPFLLMITLTVFLLATILRRQYWSAMPIMAIAVLVSQLFSFPLALCMAGCLWLVSMRKYMHAATLLTWSVLGVLCGFLLHPAAWDYFRYIQAVYFRIPFLRELAVAEMVSGVGWLSLPAIAVSVPIFLFLVLLHSRSFVRLQHAGASLVLGIVITFGFCVILWMRAIDFLWPISLLCIGLLVGQDPHGLRTAIDTILSRATQKKLVAALLCFAAIQWIFLSIDMYRSDASRDLEPYIQALANVPPHSRVLNLDWHSFSRLVSIRPDLRYATGIDGAMVYLQDPGIYSLVSFPPPEVVPTIASIIDIRAWATKILHVYPADYILLLKDWRQPLMTRLDDSPLLERLSESGSQLAVYKVSPELQPNSCEQ